MEPAFWQNKKVLIFGHTGFQGAWLSLWLRRLGAQVFGFSLGVASQPSIFQLTQETNGIDSYDGDLQNFNEVKALFAELKPEVVFHLAGCSLVGKSHQNPREAFMVNALGTLNILEAVRLQSSVRVVLTTTSDKVYGEATSEDGFQEEDPLHANDIYGCSKAAADRIALSYWQNYLKNQQQGCAIFRTGNVIGGGDWAEDRLMADLFRALQNHFPLTLRHPEAVRPWQFILDPLWGYLICAEKMWESPENFSGVYNLGPESSQMVSVNQVVDYCQTLLPKKLKLNISTLNAYPEANRLVISSEKAKEKLGWCPRLNWKQAIDWTMRWFLAYLAKKDMQQLTDEQIGQFEELVNGR